MIKRALRGAVRRARRWLAESEQLDRRAPDFSRDDSIYPFLNWHFGQIRRDRRCGQKPGYIFGVLHGAHLAKALGLDRVSVIEFGVAGGNGLIALEAISETVERVLGVGIDVYGFDTGAGLPPPKDYRDLPNLYASGYFPMDPEPLRARLRRARLVLGAVDDTIDDFVKSRPAPVAFVSIDLDFYSSTMDAFRLFEADAVRLLPRVHCYMDDIMGFTCSEFNGERLAISEFNAAHEARKISPIFGLRWFVAADQRDEMWVEKMYLTHFFDHELYGRHDGLSRHQTIRSTDLAA